MKADLIYALRTLRKNPMFTLVAILSLALGIGANTAIFGLMNYVLLRLVPVERAEELVQLDHTGPRRGSSSGSRAFSFLQYCDLRDRTQTLSGLVAHEDAPFSFSEGGQTDRVRGDIVSGNYFQVLGIRPAIGRLLTPEDDKTPGAHPVIVLSHAFWMQRFGGNPDVVNRKVLLNGEPMTILGVTERGYGGLALDGFVDVMAPATMKKVLTPTQDGLLDRRTLWLQVIGRRKPGVSIETAQAELHSIFMQINRMEIDQMGAMSERIRRNWLDKKLLLIDASHGPPDLREQMSKPVYALMAMVGLVLLIACANLANLLMARSAARRKEIAVRLALGAGRWRLVRQLLVESAMLGVIGGLAGLLVAVWTVDGLKLFLGSDAGTLTRMPSMIDARVILFNIGLSLLTGLLFGLVPALQATRPDLAPALKDEAGNVSASSGHVRLRKALIVGQVALSLLLLIGAGLFARSLYNLRSVNPGFRTESLVSFTVDAALNGYPNTRAIDFYRRLYEQLRSVPGVAAIALASEPVLANAVNQSTVTVIGNQPQEGRNMNSQANYVSPGFFSTLGTPLLVGRDFTAADNLSAPKIAIVNESFAKYYFDGENPLGRRIRTGRCTEPCPELIREIVGVVKDSMHANLRETEQRRFYYPYTQRENVGALTGYIRGNMDPAALGSVIRREVSRLDANLPVTNIQTLDTVIDRSITTERLVAMLSSAFGLLATLLAAVGLYGVMAYIVERRTREIGIRMALGALRGSVVWLVMKEVASMAAIGLAIGIPLAYAAGRLIEKQLYGLNGRDIGVFVIATIALTVVACLAGFIPARRATAIDPIRALRYE